MLNLLYSQIILSKELFVARTYGVSPENFKILSNWMSEALRDAEVDPLTSTLALQIVNQYLTISNLAIVKKQDEIKLLLVGCAAGHIASCLRDNEAIKLKEWINFGDKSFDRKDFLEMIAEIITTLSGKLLIPTSIYFLDIIELIDVENFDDKIENSDITEIEIVENVLDLCSCHLESYDHLPHELAVAAIFYVRKALKRKKSSLEIIPHEGKYLFSVSQRKIFIIMEKIHQMISQLYPLLKLEAQDVRFQLASTMITIHDALKTFEKLKPLQRVSAKGKTIPPGKESVIDKNWLKEKLGSGTYGTVYKVKPNGNSFAVKVQPDGGQCSPMIELAIMETLNHKNIQRLKGFSFQDDNVFLQMDIQRGSLHDDIYLNHKPAEVDQYIYNVWHLENKKFPVIDLAVRRNYAKQILEGLVYIHRHGIIHADIKPENMLITYDNQIKIADFGVSVAFIPGVNDYSPKSSHRGTSYYMDIILLKNYIAGDPSNYSFDVDIWATAVTFLEMEKGCNPFVSDTKQGTINNIEELLGPSNAINLTQNTLLQIYDDNFRYLLLKMLDYDNRRRVTSEQALTYL